jgi:hypothetical protein
MLQRVLGVDRRTHRLRIFGFAMGQWLVCGKKQNPRTVGQSARIAMGISIPKIQVSRGLDKPTSW